MNPRSVFVYGTLTDPANVDSVLDDWRFDGEAVLSGAHRVEGRHPTLAPGGRTAGRLLRTPALEALDAYERVADGLYVPVAVPLAGGGEARVYVGDPDRLDAPADWPGTGAFEDRVRRYVETEPVALRCVANR